MPDREEGTTPERFKRVTVTGSRKPGYLKGTVSAQRAMLQRLRNLHREGSEALVAALRAAAVGLTLPRALDLLEDHFTEWGAQVAQHGVPEVTNLYFTGLRAGAAEIGFSFAPDRGDLNAVRFLAQEPAGLVPALQNFAEEERATVERLIRRSFEGGPELFDLDAVVDRINQRVPKERYRLERIVRTETSKIAGAGRLAAWEADPNRDDYVYHWIPTLDGRHKDVSKLFGEGGPYTFIEVKKLWSNPVAVVRNRKTGKVGKQDDRFNQRCTIARTLKPRTQLAAEGRLRDEEERFWGP